MRNGGRGEKTQREKEKELLGREGESGQQITTDTNIDKRRVNQTSK